MRKVTAAIQFDWGAVPLVLSMEADAYCVRRVMTEDDPDELLTELTAALRAQVSRAAADDEFFIVRGKRGG